MLNSSIITSLSWYFWFQQIFFIICRSYCRWFFCAAGLRWFAASRFEKCVLTGHGTVSSVLNAKDAIPYTSAHCSWHNSLAVRVNVYHLV